MGETMTNEQWLKAQMCEKIRSLSVKELYELISDGSEHFCVGLCQYCAPIYGKCDENIESDEICCDRFTDWCSQKRRIRKEK